MGGPAACEAGDAAAEAGPLADVHFGQERMLLYSIINAVTDPILLTDTEGRLIIANTPRREAVRRAGGGERRLAPRRRR